MQPTKRDSNEIARPFIKESINMHQESIVVEIVAGVIALLLIAAAILAVTKRIKLPFTVILVVTGIGLSSLAARYPTILPNLHEFRISPELILYLFLPTLVFESAFNLDARQLRHNLGPVLLLAVPGLLLSTLLIGIIVSLATPIPLTAALLLGAILSATDPVACVAIFKKLGAPHRLTMLVEGESLFNDATSIVLARILIGVIAAGTVTAGAIGKGVIDFFVVFIGGLAVGWLLALVTGFLLGKVETDPLIEITLTIAIAYASFLVAEEAFHVSGVMATIAAGLTIGGWGRIKVSPSVRTYLDHFWEYIAFIANALIFLMVGMRVELSELWATSGMLVWVILSMLVSRAAVVYGLMPLAGRLPGAEAVGRRYQAVMYWGGLRGAIALAIVLSLPAFDQSEAFVALAMGAVLFTLLFQATTIEALVRRLGLDRPPLSDRFAQVESHLVAKQQAMARLPELLSGGLFSGSIADRLKSQCEAELERIKDEIEELRKTELDGDNARPLLYLRAFAEEKALYIEMFNKGQLSESAFRHLSMTLASQIDAARYAGEHKHLRTRHFDRYTLEKKAIRFLERIPVLDALAERLHLARVALDYEISWGHYQSSGRAIEILDELAEHESMPAAVLEEVRDQLRLWREAARQHLDHTAEQFPEFVNALQERLGHRLVLFAEAEAFKQQADYGTLPHSVAEHLEEEITEELHALRGREIARLKVEPTELLRKVPFFRDIPPKEFADIAARMRAHTVSENDPIIRQGEKGDSLFLIARGVVRVYREEGGIARALATLMAGDFFGEMALLHSEPRTATVSAVTPCSLYELRREDLDVAIEAHPSIRQALEEADLRRKAAIGK